ncbi:hypothetical protein [Aeromicrobium sp. UC242_57]|uniref:hypothetical protein n=1 Tax=Aeromicrobium sp. UC242_57 TaxID=3374624 RepID=UPI003799B00E
MRGGAPQTYLDRLKGGLGGFVEDLAHEYRIPLVMFMEGIGGDVAAQAEKGHSYLVSRSAGSGRTSCSPRYRCSRWSAARPSAAPQAAPS